jgi:hypothetical protein
MDQYFCKSLFLRIRFMRRIKYFIFLLVILQIGGCELYWDLPKLATVETNIPSDIMDVTAKLNGYVKEDGGAKISERGFCINKSPKPTIEHNKVQSGNGTGIFSSNISGLTSNTTYYVRAYAINKAGVSYGNEVTFQTASIAILTTNNVSSITQSSAVCGGNISNSGGLTVTSRGVCFNTAANPTILNSKVISGSGVGSFSVAISGLTPSSTYYVRAFATNSLGTAYGNEVIFQTAGLATIITSEATTITQTSATCGGNITNAGGLTITSRGICYGTTSNPTILNTKVVSGSGTGIFSTIITNLIAGTKYYARAYATNSAGTAYGNEISFSTLLPLLPTVTTVSASSLTTTSAISGGNVSNDGGGVVTERGLCYSTNSNPTVSNVKLPNGSGLGSFTSTIVGLVPNTQYYLRAYAINSAGTAYGNEITFTTNQILLPVLTTSPSSSVTSNSVVSGGDITSDGGGEITLRGICYATTTSPTISNNILTNGSGIGTYSVSITGLSSATKYYLRAFATNSAGTAYGNEVIVTTNPVFTIGMSYQGGLIFYIDGTANHGLIASLSNIPSGSTASWGCSGTTLSNSSGTIIGTGLTNTNSIVTGCATSNIAARLCFNLSMDGYDDWFLPSKDELYLMYTNLKLYGLGNFTTSYYWSSSQYSSTAAWILSFSSGATTTGSKSSVYYVRAVRAF